jgi:hypothetical protein
MDLLRRQASYARCRAARSATVQGCRFPISIPSAASLGKVVAASSDDYDSASISECGRRVGENVRSANVASLSTALAGRESSLPGSAAIPSSPSWAARANCARAAGIYMRCLGERSTSPNVTRWRLPRRRPMRAGVGSWDEDGPLAGLSLRHAPPGMSATREHVLQERGSAMVAALFGTPRTRSPRSCPTRRSPC